MSITKRQIIRYIQKSYFWIAEAPGILVTVYPWIVGFPGTKRYFSFGFDRIVVSCADSYIHQFLDQNKNFFLTEKLIEDYKSGRLRKYYFLWEKHRKAALDNFNYLDELKLRKLSDRELTREYLRLMDLFTLQWTIPLILEGAAIYTERSIYPRFKKENRELTNKEANEYFAILTQPDELSFASGEHLNFLWICREAAANKNLLAKIKKNLKLSDLKKESPAIYRLLTNHQKKYHWIRNNYLHAKPVRLSDFFDLTKELLITRSPAKIVSEIKKIKNHKKKIISDKKKTLAKIQLSKSLQDEIKAVSFFGFWQDERKEMNLKGNYHIVRALDEFSQRSGIDHLRIQCALPQEMSHILKEGKRKWLPVLKERSKKMVVVNDWKKGLRIFIGKEADEIWKHLFPKKKINVKNLVMEGTVVSRGGKDNIQGTVRIVLDPAKDEFKPGEILVTSMTRPEFVPLMKKARAIVTNEGGMTCHAAIVSRELGIPAIVGTKIATRVLKDGDIVEVDANNGVIKIIK